MSGNGDGRRERKEEVGEKREPCIGILRVHCQRKRSASVEKKRKEKKRKEKKEARESKRKWEEDTGALRRLLSFEAPQSTPVRKGPK